MKIDKTLKNIYTRVSFSAVQPTYFLGRWAMQLRVMRESFGEFHQHQYDDGGELGDYAYVAFKDWGRNNSDPITINDLKMSEIDGDVEENGDPTEINDTEDDDLTVDDIDDDELDEEADKKAHPRHTGPQRVIPHGGFRGADWSPSCGALSQNGKIPPGNEPTARNQPTAGRRSSSDDTVDQAVRQLIKTNSLNCPHLACFFCYMLYYGL